MADLDNDKDPPKPTESKKKKSKKREKKDEDDPKSFYQYFVSAGVLDNLDKYIPIVYSDNYNISFFGLEKLHPFVLPPPPPLLSFRLKLTRLVGLLQIQKCGFRVGKGKGISQKALNRADPNANRGPPPHRAH